MTPVQIAEAQRRSRKNGNQHFRKAPMFPPNFPLDGQSSEYSTETRKVQSTSAVVMDVIIGQRRQMRDIHPETHLDFGLDQKAI